MSSADNAPEPRLPETLHMPDQRPAPPRVVPRDLRHYHVERELGRGAMGVVYLAQDTRLKRPVAVKVLSDEIAEDTDALQRFEREAQLLATLSHPNIATVHALDEIDGLRFLILEYLPGATLAEELASGAIPVTRSIHIGRQIASALQAAHESGVVHRDLKPSNIKITQDLEVKVLDFGIAKVLTETPEANLTVVGAIVGTPGYMSPEQLRGQDVNERCDIWALGCILYECLTAQPAYPANTLTEYIVAALDGEPDWDRLPAATPPEVRSILKKCLAKQSADRPATVSVVRRALDEEIAREALPTAYRTHPDEANTTPGIQLPRQLTSFIGRERQLADIDAARRGGPLLTLTGIGGSGKTRLLIEAGRRAIADFPDGVSMVELAPVAEHERVLETVAKALGLQEDPARELLAVVIDHLREREALLLLDNCEHLLGACSSLSEHLLRSCPRLKIMASSREGLGVSGETIYQVSSMALPPAETLTLEECREIESVQLFVERAQTARPGFELTPDLIPSVQQVCRRLDGIPLALELAAARVRMLPVDEIASRLDDRFRLLTGGSKTALPRQQTLRATIDWSYEHLSEEERTLLRRLSVFVGGWTLEAAEVVCAGDGLDEWQVLDLLSTLADKSLVEVDLESGQKAGVARHRLLSTVRQYAGDRLIEQHHEREARRRHRAYFLAFVENAEPHLTTPAQAQWLARLEAEHDNLRAALENCLADTDGVEQGLLLAGSLWRFWLVRGPWQEGRSFLTELLAKSDPNTPTPGRVKALNAAGVLANVQIDHERALDLCQQSLETARQLDDRRGMARALANLGNVARCMHDFDAARRHLEASLIQLDALGDTYGIAVTEHNLAYLAWDQKDLDRARSLFEKGLAHFRELGDVFGMAWSLSLLGVMAYERDDLITSRDLHVESLELKKQIGEPFGIAASRLHLGQIEVQLDNLDAARTYLRASLETLRDVRQGKALAECVVTFAELAMAEGRLERSLVLFAGAAEYVGDRLEIAQRSRDTLDRGLDEGRRALADTGLGDELERRGTRMKLDELIRFTLDDVDP